MKKLSFALIFSLLTLFTFAQQQPPVGIQIGQTAPEIALPNANGDTVKLSSLRGKVVLIDFWASWCNPCRKENPIVVAAYTKYNDKTFSIGNGFTVYGVSLDKAKDSWTTAIAKDGLVWNNVSDLLYWNSVAAKEYGVSGIPSNVLIDSEGVIIAKNLRGPALEETLEKYRVIDPLEMLESQKKDLDKTIEIMKQSSEYQAYGKNFKKIEKKLAELQKEIDFIKSSTTKVE